MKDHFSLADNEQNQETPLKPSMNRTARLKSHPAFRIASYVVALFLLLFGGLLIGGSCGYTRSVDESLIPLSLGLLVTFASLLLIRNSIYQHRIFFGVLAILYSIALFYFGQYVKNSSKSFSESTAMDFMYPNIISLTIYYMTSLCSFLFGTIALIGKLRRA